MENSDFGWINVKNNGLILIFWVNGHLNMNSDARQHGLNLCKQGWGSDEGKSPCKKARIEPWAPQSVKS